MVVLELYRKCKAEKETVDATYSRWSSATDARRVASPRAVTAHIMQTATTSSSGTVLPFGAVLPSHALDAHLRRIERARDAAATSVRNPSCENLRQLWNNNDRASHAACEPVLWKVFQEITDASSSFNLSGLSDASSGTTHQFHKRPMQATAFRRMLQLAASSTSPLARGIYDNNMAPWAQSTRMDIRPIRTVCEVGFNAGHSAALWLENTAVEHLHSFDVLDHPYSKAQVELVSRLYPGRFTMHGGDSRRTLPQFASQLKSMPVHERSPQHGSLCDLWYIDGGHVGVLPAADMGNAIRSSHNGTTMVCDDCTNHWAYVKNSFKELQKRNKLGDPWPIPMFQYYKSNKAGWCAGLVNKTS